MEVKILEHITCKILPGEVLSKMGMPPDHRFAPDIAECIKEMEPVANAKAKYSKFKIDSKTEDTLTINGITFTSRALVEAVGDSEYVYPYICTCGKESDSLAWGCKDLVKMLYYDTINHFYLREAVKEVSRVVDDDLSSMSSCLTPGAKNAWDLTEQQKLFTLLGGGDEIGVTLTENSIMYPAKSVSGFRFEVPAEKHDCRICMRTDCPKRGAAFDGLLYDKTLC